MHLVKSFEEKKCITLKLSNKFHKEDLNYHPQFTKSFGQLLLLRKKILK